ncbi:MAG: hypothetical protein ACREJO_06495 [Phycisphaerales bacterium]
MTNQQQLHQTLVHVQAPGPSEGSKPADSSSRLSHVATVIGTGIAFGALVAVVMYYSYSARIDDLTNKLKDRPPSSAAAGSVSALKLELAGAIRDRDAARKALPQASPDNRDQLAALTNERDEARSAASRLTAERDALKAEVARLSGVTVIPLATSTLADVTINVNSIVRSGTSLIISFDLMSQAPTHDVAVALDQCVVNGPDGAAYPSSSVLLGTGDRANSRRELIPGIRLPGQMRIDQVPADVSTLSVVSISMDPFLGYRWEQKLPIK